MGNLRLVRRFRIFFALLFLVEMLLGNSTAMNLAMCAYLVTVYIGHDMMERVFLAAIEEAESEGVFENENGTRAGVGRVDEPKDGPREEDQSKGSPR